MTISIMSRGRGHPWMSDKDGPCSNTLLRISTIASLPILQSVPRPHVKKYILYVFCERSKVFRMID